MGESVLEVEAPKAENKMGESVTHIPRLEQSVSFGRFEHDDSLCWERWSTFPSNKYLEEVEKCSTPGSVAKKKAYFEAHYKKIAARKAELLDQDQKIREIESSSSEDQGQILMGSICNSNSSEGDVDDEKSHTHNSVYGTELENQATASNGKMKDVHIDVLSEGVVFISEDNGVPDSSDGGVDIIDEEHKEMVNEHNVTESNGGVDIVDEEDREMVNEHNVAESNGGVDIIQENELVPQTEEAHEDLYPEKEVSEVVKSEEPVLVKEEDAVAVSQNEDEKQQDKVQEREVIKKATQDVKLKISNKTHKVTPMKKTTNTSNATTKKPESVMPKKSAAPRAKPPMSSTSTMSLKPALSRTTASSTPTKSFKPTLPKTTMPTTRTLVKKESGFTTPMTTTKVSRPEIKRILPTSLHMSLSLGPGNSDPTTRKSLIMERMGDKDIIKRAFKSFQNTTQRSASNAAKDPTTSQSTIRKTEQKGSVGGTLQKKREGMTGAANPSSPLYTQQPIKKTSAAPGLRKTTGVVQRNGRSIPASLSPRNQDQGNKQKEVSKNMEQKSKIKQAGKTQLQANIKVETGANVKKPSHSKLSRSYDQGHGFLKRLHKGDARTASTGTSN